MQPHSLPQKHKEGGKFHLPGVKDLPHGLQVGFRDTFIRRMIKVVFGGVLPWSNPSLDILQHEFNLVYLLPCY